ncbi:MAG: hypothetical protein JWQ24_1679 [Tardiphaga sp.]|nr:hypothetical protein [Tardiphaga sp.]
MRARMPWPVGRKVLVENDFPRGRGWEQTVTKLGSDQLKVTGNIEDLAAALSEHILCGEKLSGFYNVDIEVLDRVRAKVLGMDVEETDFSRSYPAALTEDQLADQHSGFVLTAVSRTEDGVAVVFSSVRVVTVREEIEPEEISDELASLLEGYEEIVGLKTVRFQAFDVIWIPHNGSLIDVRVDYPAGTHQDVAIAAHARIVDAFHTLVDELLMAETVNLFPLIDRIYNDPSEGIVVELGFGTTTASLKNEKMRRKQLDLREEQYHVGGKAALTSPIEPFRLSVTWKRNVGGGRFSSPELSLNSNARAAGGIDPAIRNVVIRRCMGQADYEFVRSRIEHHLATESSAEQKN